MSDLLKLKLVRQGKRGKYYEYLVEKPKEKEEDFPNIYSVLVNISKPTLDIIILSEKGIT